MVGVEGGQFTVDKHDHYCHCLPPTSYINSVGKKSCGRLIAILLLYMFSGSTVELFKYRPGTRSQDYIILKNHHTYTEIVNLCSTEVEQFTENCKVVL